MVRSTLLAYSRHGHIWVFRFSRPAFDWIWCQNVNFKNFRRKNWQAEKMSEKKYKSQIDWCKTSFDLSACTSVCSFLCLSVCLFMPSVCSSVHLSVCVHPYVRPPVRLFVYLSVFFSIALIFCSRLFVLLLSVLSVGFFSVRPSVYLSVRSSVRLCVRPCVSRLLMFLFVCLLLCLETCT